MFIEKYISDLSTDFGGRNQTIGKINFSMHRNKRMKSLLHWVHFFYRFSAYLTMVDLNKVMFIQELDTDMQRAEIINNIIAQYSTKAK